MLIGSKSKSIGSHFFFFFDSYSSFCSLEHVDQLRFLENCPPNPPLTHVSH